jgi:hypothetical protein
MRARLAPLALTVTLVLPVEGQGRDSGPRVSAADSAAVLAVVQGLFDAMARRDTVAARALLLPGAHFASLRTMSSTQGVRQQADTTFLRSLAAGRERLLERMWNPSMRVQGNLAEVWTLYDFHVDGRFSHCGIDNFILVRTRDVWQIMSIVYTVQMDGCPASPLGPPK